MIKVMEEGLVEQRSVVIRGSGVGGSGVRYPTKGYIRRLLLSSLSLSLYVLCQISSLLSLVLAA